MDSQFSVMVQGPLDRCSLDNIAYYKTLGPVIISHWDTCDESLLDDIECCRVVKKPAPIVKAYLRDTFDYQIHSILNGLSVVDTAYTIRMRSDERFDNLEPMLDKFNANVNKVVCGNIFFRKWNVSPFHIGDHLFVGRTDVLYETYHRLAKSDHDFNPHAFPEHMLTHVMMDAILPEGTEHTRESFEECFDIVSLNDLKPFVVAHRHAGVVYTDEFNDISCANSLEDL